MHYNIIANAYALIQSDVISFGKMQNLIVLDGAIEYFKKYNTIPNVVIGDFDSAQELELIHMETKGCLVLHKEDQNKSDLQKGIEFCLDRKAYSINIYNALGARQDHHILNLRLLKKYFSTSCAMTLVHEDEEIRFLQNATLELNGYKGSRVALMSFPNALINSNGLLYDMHDYTINFADSESSSNKLKYEKASLRVAGHALLITENNIKVSICYG